jgi:hypothetical protein
MNTQLAMFDEPVAVRSFEQDAYGFLIAYAKRSKGQPFSSEDVTLAALDAGLAPVDLRRWGSIFVQAAKDGYIRRSDVLFRRAMGNSSLAPGWVGI